MQPPEVMKEADELEESSSLWVFCLCFVNVLEVCRQEQ